MSTQKIHSTSRYIETIETIENTMVFINEKSVFSEKEYIFSLKMSLFCEKYFQSGER